MKSNNVCLLVVIIIAIAVMTYVRLTSQGRPDAGVTSNSNITSNGNLLP